MAKDGSHQSTTPTAAARQCVATLCQQVSAGKRAARQLARCVAPHGVAEADFRLLWELFILVEAPLAGMTVDDAKLEPALDQTTLNQTRLDQTRLAERLNASPAHVSAAVERLRAAGLIGPIAPAADRRRQCWQLTFAGRDLVLAVLASVSAVDADAADAATTQSTAARAAA